MEHDQAEDERGDDPPCVGCGDKTGAMPHEIDDAALPPLPADAVLRVPADVQLAVVGAELVAHRPATGMTNVCNTSAAMVLTSFDGVLTLADVVDALQVEVGPSVDVAADVARIAARLTAVGALEFVNPPGGVFSVETTPEPVVELEQPPAVVGTWRVGTNVAAVAAPDEVASELHARLAHLEPVVADEVSGVVVRVFEAGEAGEWHLRAGGEPVLRTLGIGGAIEETLRALNRVAAVDADGHILLHAASASRHGRCVAVAGTSGQGKTTLVGALVRAGFDFVSDEVVVIDPTTRAVTPYLRPLDLDDDARHRLGLVDEVDDVVPGLVDPTRLGSLAGEPPVLGLLVLLGAETSLATDVDPLVADLLDLLPQVFPASFGRPDALDRLLDLVGDVRVLRLDRGPLRGAVAAVEHLLG